MVRVKEKVVNLSYGDGMQVSCQLNRKRRHRGDFKTTTGYVLLYPE